MAAGFVVETVMVLNAVRKPDSGKSNRGLETMRKAC